MNLCVLRTFQKPVLSLMFLTFTDTLKSKVVACIADIACWMKSNRLQLNLSKLEFLWCDTTRRLDLINQTTFHLDDGDVISAVLVRNLTTYFNANMDMLTYIKHLVGASFYKLGPNPVIRQSIPTSTGIRLINSFIISRIDYCNGLVARSPCIPVRKDPVGLKLCC